MSTKVNVTSNDEQLKPVRVPEIEVIDGKILRFNLAKKSEDYPIANRDGVLTIVPKIPKFNNIIIMAVYDVTVNNLLMSNAPKDLKPITNRYYVAAVDANGEFNIGDKVLLGNTEFLGYISVNNNHRTPDRLKEFISEAYPELTIGTAAALDKSRSKIGLRTERKIMINPVTYDKAIKDSTNSISELITGVSDVVTVVVYYVCPPHAVAVVDEEPIMYDRINNNL